VTASPGTVVDDAAHHRFVVVQDGLEAELVYRRVGRRLVLVHTEVPDALSRHGIGGQLVRAAVDRARHEDLSLVPYCSFAVRWLRDHTDAVAGLAIDWPVNDAVESRDHPD
jgi:predicted GNAT family acetyltransferase